MPCCEANLLALALRSKMDKEGVSSINKGAVSKAFTLTFNCSHSCFSSLPVLSFSEDNPVSEEISLVINCTEDISNEKNATPWLLFTAILRAMESVRAVLPIPGLAATIIKSLGCHPEVSLSSLSKPDGIPLSPSLLAISSIRFLACMTRFCAVSAERFKFPWVTSYSLDSAASNKSKTSVLSS